MTKHFPVEKPRHDPRVEESITALRRLEADSSDMTLGIERLLVIQNQMVHHCFFLAEVETNYLRSWRLAESERKARYSEVFVEEKPGKTDALAKEATNLKIKKEYYNEIHGEWKYKSVKRVCEVATDAVNAIKDRIKNKRDERRETRQQP